MRIEALGADTLKAAWPLAQRWEYSEPEFARVVSWSDGCSVVALDHGEALGMSLGFPWEPVGWIGAVRVLEEHRGRGLGGDLVNATIAALRAHGCATVKLYARPKAQPLYTRLGFQGEAEYVLARGGHRRGRAGKVVPLADHLDEAIDLDASVFPGDRGRLIRELAAAHPELAVAALDGGALAGFGLARPGEPSEVGPLVVADGDAAVAQEIVDALLSMIPEGDVEVAYPRASFAGRSSWECRGFTVFDTPLEMRLGPAVEEARECIVSCAGQEVG